jgi:NAD(P)-dependent dehydrogenase (short-subunit alcohol dehydrogenase family)
MYVIIGANGNIGRKVAKTLLTAGKKVSVVSRDLNRLQLLSEKIVESHGLPNYNLPRTISPGKVIPVIDVCQCPFRYVPQQCEWK